MNGHTSLEETTPIPDSVGMQDLTVLNVVIATPEDREGAVRAGLQLGDALHEFVSVDNLKMGGDHDQGLVDDLGIRNPVYELPSVTTLRDIADKVADLEDNYANVLIGTRLKSPQPLREYDIVHIHNAVPLTAMCITAAECKAQGIPYCVTTHGVSKIPELPENMDMNSVTEQVFKWTFLKPYFAVLKHSVHVFALSERDKETIQERFPEKSVSVTPNGVSVNPPTEAGIKRADAILNSHEDIPVVLFVGKILPGKGVEDLLTAVELLDHDAKIIVAGGGMNSSLVKKLEESPIDYLGYVDGETIQALYQRADIFVFPTRSDVFPLVVLEAMASSTPVVSTKVGGIPEQVTSDVGTLVEPRDPDELASAIDELLSDPEKREMMGRSAMERVKERFSWNQVAEDTAAEYGRIIDNE